MNILRIILVIVLGMALRSNCTLKAQVIGIEDTERYLNDKFDGKITVNSKKKHIEIVFFKNGEKYRTDKIFPLEIDYESIAYSDEENGVVVACKSENKCIERKIPHLKIVDYYARIVFETNSKDGQNGIKEALIHLIKLFYFSDLERTEPFE